MASSIEYDAAIIHQFAGHLYAQARAIIVRYTILGVMTGALAAGIGGAALARDEAAGAAGGLLGALIGGALGLSAGRDRAFALKLQAQTALCQLQIEANTRTKQARAHAA
jgi:hypothetical protein